MLDTTYMNNLIYHYYICTLIDEDRNQRLATFGQTGIFHVPELAFVHRFMQNICYPLYNSIGVWPQIERESRYYNVNLIDLTISVANYFLCFEFKMDGPFSSVVSDGQKLKPALQNGALCYLADIKAEWPKSLTGWSSKWTNDLNNKLDSDIHQVVNNFFYISAPYENYDDQWAAIAGMWQLDTTSS